LKRAVRWYDAITLNVYWFALTARAQVLTPLVIPLLVQRYVGEGAKGTYVGVMRLWALMVALLAQAVMGLLSDHSTSRWGRRRPYVLMGTLGEGVVFALIGLSAGLEGRTGYWTLFALYVLSMVSSNAAQAASQSLIPDLVPEDRRGLFSGIKALLEVPLPLIFVSMVVSKQVSAGDLWGALLSVVAATVLCMAITLLVPERRYEASPAPNWKPILRLVAMTAAFTAIVLGIGAAVQAILRIRAGVPANAGLATTALVGLLGMVAAIVLGVGVSMRLGIGDEIRRNRSFVWWVMNRLTFLLAANSLSGFMLYFFQERFADLSGARAATPAATAILIVGVCVLIIAVLGGWLCDRLGRRPLIVLSGVLAAVGMTIVLSVPTVAAIYGGGALVGVAVGLYYPASWALGTDLVPRDQAGRYLGLANLAGAGAGAIGAYVGGPIADRTSYVLLFGMYATLFLLSALTVFGMRERNPEHT
jgi:MFS family permease